MIVVTGGAGFIGSALVWKLNQLGVRRILVVDQLETSEKWRNLAHLTFEDYMPKDQFLHALEQGTFAERPRAIVHLGACSSTTERDADFLLVNNYRYTRTLAEWCLARGVRFIYASSAATYGDGSRGYSDRDDITPGLRPLNQYGYSKQLFDLWALRTRALDTISGLKFFNVFGPNEYHKDDMSSVVLKAYHQVLASGQVRLFKSYRDDYPDGGQQRDFIYVKDCLDVMVWLIENRVGGLFNVGTGQARTWNDLAHAVFRAMGREPKIEYIEMPEALQGRYQYFTQADMTRLRAAGYRAPFTSLEDAVSDYVNGYLAADTPYLEC
ncbi:MAG TPA: ADP-glyceromanno-heptose 6-epimerase [Pirellulales bacterium]|jgi:ADP-L-glycero-D-manno-heptose 6-epimerase|nr:ADP-glyceromanno-heptose 6-epimerase [Pirellulales bacterium]